MAMRHPKSIVLSGALTALIIMTVSATVMCYLQRSCFFGSHFGMIFAWYCDGLVLATIEHYFSVL